MRLVKIVICVSIITGCIESNKQKNPFTVSAYDIQKERLIEKTYNYNAKGKNVLVKLKLVYSDTTRGITLEEYDPESENKIFRKHFASDGRINGIQEYYYENGELKDQLSYSYGQLNGECYSYYSNGIIQAESLWDHGLKNGEAKFYDQNGILKEYRFFAPDGSLSYICKIEEGTIVKEEGSMIPIVAFDNLNGKFITNDTIKSMIYLPVPFHITSQVQLTVENNVSRKIVYSDNMIVDKPITNIPLIINESGSYNFKLHSIHEYLRDTIEFSSADFDIEVKDAEKKSPARAYVSPLK